MERDRTPLIEPPMRGTNWPTIALLGGLLLVLLIIAYFTANRDPDQDRLSDSQVTTSLAPVAAEKSCASKSTYDQIKRELFRAAAQRRGSDAAAYDRLAAYAVARMESPVMENEPGAGQAVECSGTLSLDLPPGVVAEGGRRTLMSGVDYSVQPAADGSGNVVLVRNAEAIIGPLATLARAAQSARPDTPPAKLDIFGQPIGNVPLAGPDALPPIAAPPVPATPPPPPSPRVIARPSFDCAKARTRGEIAVCADPGLAALDRQMVGQFNRAIDQSDPQQRFLLLRTRAEFLEYRDRCRGASCVADAYNGRLREIGDIMANRPRQR